MAAQSAGAEAVGPRPELASAIKIRPRTATAPRTTITIAHRIPSPGPGRRVRWLITTEPGRLPAREFDSAAAINERAGRAIRCVDVATNTTVAAIAYHVDEGHALPLLITAIATRTDPDWAETSHGAVLIIKAYLHQAGAMLGRPGEVGCFPGSQARAAEYTGRYGFKRASVPAAWRASGLRYVEQTAS